MDQVDLAAQVYSHADDSAHSGIHSLSIATAGKDGQTSARVLVLDHRLSLLAFHESKALEPRRSAAIVDAVVSGSVLLLGVLVETGSAIELIVRAIRLVQTNSALTRSHILESKVGPYFTYLTHRSHVA